MIVLVLNICLGGDCRVERHPLWGATLMHCVMGGPQVQDVIRQAARPGETVRWHCETERDA